MTGEILAIYAAVGVLFGILSASIAQGKGHPAFGYFVAGLLLGVIGLILAIAARPVAAAPQPPGWYPDPWAQAAYRWYDGYQWTYHLAPGQAPV